MLICCSVNGCFFMLFFGGVQDKTAAFLHIRTQCGLITEVFCHSDNAKQPFCLYCFMELFAVDEI